MKGEQQLKLSHDSVREALEHYLLEHFAQNVVVSVVRWTHTESGEPGEAGMPCVLVDFRAGETDAALAVGLAAAAPSHGAWGDAALASATNGGTAIPEGVIQHAQPLPT